MALVLNGTSDTITGLQINSANIVDGSIVNADINDLAASKLTGALPAISGAALTGIETSTVASGQEGVYFLFGASAIDDVQRNDIVNIKFYKNGSSFNNYTGGRVFYSSSSTPNMILLSTTLNTVVSLAVGDYVELFIYHNEGSTEPTEAGPTYFGGYKL